jgi:hypothetical protein
VRGPATLNQRGHYSVLCNTTHCKISSCENKVNLQTLPRNNTMDQYIKQDWEFQIGICMTCKIGIPKDYILRHFSIYHKDTWKAHRKALTQHMEGLRLVSTRELDHPMEKREPVEWLEIKDGWTCGWNGCIVSGVNKDWVQTHCRQTHGREAVEAKSLTQARLQTLFGHPHIKYLPFIDFQLTNRYFPVDEQLSTITRQSRQDDAFIKAIHAAKADEAESLNTVHQSIGDNKLSVRTPWLGATKWMERFAGANMDTLSELTEMAKNRNDYLTVVCTDMGNLMEECHSGLRDLKAREWDRILFWLKSSKETIIHSKPLSIYLQRKTVETYAGYWQRLICFCFRALEEPSCQPGGENQGFRFTAEQEERLMILKTSYEFEDGNPQSVLTRRSLLLELSLSLIRQEVHIVGVPVLVYFAGILGYEKTTGQWKQPVNYTNILAGLIWCMRVLVLEYAIPKSRRKDFAGNASIRPIDQFKQVRDKTLVEEMDCPFATLLSLRNYGMLIARDSIGETRVKWSDDGQTLLFWGHLTTMHDWKSFVWDMLEEAEVMLGKQLLFQKDGGLPDVNIWDIRDDHDQSKVGYYFASEDSGGWDGARVQMGQWLGTAKDPLGLLGTSDDGGVQQFIRTAVDKYNTLDVSFRIRLYLLVLFTSGSPPRGTEMTALKFMNTREGQRDILVSLGRIMMVTSYHKSIGITGNAIVSQTCFSHLLTEGNCTISTTESGQTPCHLPSLCCAVPSNDQWELLHRGQRFSVWRCKRTMADRDGIQVLESLDGKGIGVGDDTAAIPAFWFSNRTEAYST